MMSETERLTQAEVDALPEDTRVRVIWSGGNGPHTYLVRRRAGQPTVYAAVLNARGRDAWWNRPLTGIGDEHWQTRVTLPHPHIHGETMSGDNLCEFTHNDWVLCGQPKGNGRHLDPSRYPAAWTLDNHPYTLADGSIVLPDVMLDEVRVRGVA